MHRTDKYSQHSSIIWPVWLNGWVFVYELNDCGFESRCSHLYVYLCWSLARIKFEYTEFDSDLDGLQVLFFQENVLQKIKSIYLSWSSVPQLIGIDWILFWCSIFFLRQKNTLFVQIQCPKLTLFVWAKIWYQDRVEHAEIRYWN